MKKLIAFILTLVCVLGLVGCNTTQNKQNDLSETTDFAFAYKHIAGTFACGERVGLSVELTNQQNESYVWTGSQSNYRARVKLICNNSGAEYSISPEPIPDTDDFKNKIRDTDKYHQRLADSSDYRLELYSQPAVADVDSRHNVQQIMYIVSHLPRRQSVVMTLWLKGYSCSEIAHMLGITAGGVRNHIFHARKNIKKMLEK